MQRRGEHTLARQKKYIYKNSGSGFFYLRIRAGRYFARVRQVLECCGGVHHRRAGGGGPTAAAAVARGLVVFTILNKRRNYDKSWRKKRRRNFEIRDILPGSLRRQRILILSTALNHTAKTKCRKFETNITRKGISGSQSQFPHSCVCERIIYSHDGSAFSAGGNMWTDPGNI